MSKMILRTYDPVSDPDAEQAVRQELTVQNLERDFEDDQNKVPSKFATVYGIDQKGHNFWMVIDDDLIDQIKAL